MMEVLLGGVIFIFVIIGLVVTSKCIKEKIRMWFGEKKEDKVMEAVDKVNETTRNEYTKHTEQWVWIDGFKGTDKDMKCRDYQYELNKCFDISDGQEIKECEHGFHLCLGLHDVMKFYPFRYNNRFFKVKALVRKDDIENYGYYKDLDGLLRPTSRKLVAKSIIFTEELNLDYLCEYMNIGDWTTEQKEKAREFGIETAVQHIRVETLTKMGYSETFSNILASNEYYDIAYMVGTQENLSMDMKVWTIFSYNPNKNARKRR